MTLRLVQCRREYLSIISLHHHITILNICSSIRYEFRIPPKTNYAKLWRKNIQEIFDRTQKVPSDMNLIGWFGMIQSDVNLHNTDRIIL